MTHLQASLPLGHLCCLILYLGIKLTANPSDLYSSNYPPILSYLTTLLTKWSSLLLAWMSRITTVKMIILPKILYLFRVLPIPGSELLPLFVTEMCIFLYLAHN